jgi:hypothetical protein
MKTALAFVCSLMLAWTNVLAQVPGASVVSAASSCHCDRKASCCAAKHSSSESSPVSTAPVSSFQNEFSPLAPAALAWTLPVVPARELSSSLPPFLTTAGTALFARDCARLI